MNREILRKKKLFLLDMDGTIYLDNILFKDSLNFLNYIKYINGNYIFLTNNSSKSVKDYVKKLNSLNIPVNSDNFMTSSQATAIFLKEHYENKNIYVLGTKSLKKELFNNKLNIFDTYKDDIDCIVVGFDTELQYSKLVDVCKLLNKEVDYIATNPDLVCPTSYGFIPDCGSICNMIEISTRKKPYYIGKPNTSMIDLAVKYSGFSYEETIIIGDRLYTDIACGINAGITTALVLSGETNIGDIENTEYKPDFVFEDISELYNKII